MGQDQKSFQKDIVAELANGDFIVPESEAEADFLQDVSADENLSDEQKDRVARMGTLFTPTSFDVNFNTTRQKKHPTNLDPQLRQMIQEV